MKVRRLTIEVEVPYEVQAHSVLQRLRVGFGELCEFVPHQEQVIKDEVSPNTQIGPYTRYPCKEK